MNILVSVNTPFQMIVATQLSVTEFRNDSVELIISDHIAQYKQLAARAVETGLFRRVSTIEAKNDKWQSWKYTALGAVFNDKLYLKNSYLREEKYDKYLFANTGGVSECIATLLRARDGTELIMYEDGFSSYSDLYKQEIFKASSNPDIKSKILYGYKKRALAYVSQYYVFNPSLLSDWHFDFEIRRIDGLDENAIMILNKLFDYREAKDDYGSDYIFFEESYFADGIDINDVEIVKAIADIVGRDKLLVKIHPRNPYDRFESMGIATNKDTSIPWEIIALNLELRDKTLITIASGSSITSYFVSGRRAKRSILLYEMEEVDKSKLTKTIPVFDMICKEDGYFVYPHSASELRDILIKGE